MTTPKADELGVPDIKVGTFAIWILRRQIADAKDYWDGNWLQVVVHCGSQSADAWATGPILHLGELEDWLQALGALHNKLPGEAVLDCTEPNLGTKMTLDAAGRGRMEVRLTADHLTEEHRFTFEVDQSYLPDLMACLRHVLRRYPIRGKRPTN